MDTSGSLLSKVMLQVSSWLILTPLDRDKGVFLAPNGFAVLVTITDVSSLLFSSTMEKAVTVIYNYKLWQAIKTSIGGLFSLFSLFSLCRPFSHVKCVNLAGPNLLIVGYWCDPSGVETFVLGLRTLFPATPWAQQLTPLLSHEKQLQYCCWLRRMWLFGVFI